MKTEHKVIGLSIIAGVSLWLIDALVDSLFSYDGALLFDVPAHEIYMRSLVLGSFIMFGVLLSRTSARHNKAEEETREAKEYLNNVIESSLDCIVVANGLGHITKPNKAFLELLGYEEQEVVGKPVSALAPTEEGTYQSTTGEVVEIGKAFFDDAIATISKLIEEGKVSTWESYFLRKDRKVVAVEQSIVYLYDEAGSITGSVGTIRDITERKRAEEALRANEERLRSVVETAQDAILTGDSSGKIISWNSAAEAIFGYSAAEILSKSWALITPERYREVGEGEMKRATSAAKVDNAIGQPIERIGLRKDGSEFFMEVSRAAWKTEAGAFFTAIIRDITERKRAEAELKWTMAELARSNAELEQFAYVASHDLQEPLRMVSSYTQLLAKRYKDKLDDDANEFISFAVDGATRMGGLIDDLLAYSRVGTRGNDFEPVDCSDVLNQALGNLQVAIKESGAVLTHDRLPTVMAEPSQLVQLFQNLIGNAIKFQDNGEAPRVHVSADQEGNEWTFSFCDNGVGIDPQFAERIFMIFQRLHGRGEYSGTGIGLAICKKIVERHGGRIWVDSEPGRGSTFYFTIPMRGGEKA